MERTGVRCRLCGRRTWRLDGDSGDGLVKLHFVAQHGWVPRWLRPLFVRQEKPAA